MMKILLTLFVLFFSSPLFSKEFYIDCFCKSITYEETKGQFRNARCNVTTFISAGIDVSKNFSGSFNTKGNPTNYLSKFYLVNSIAKIKYLNAYSIKEEYYKWRLPWYSINPLKDINGQSIIGLYGFYDYYFTLNRFNLIMTGELYFHPANKNYNINNVVRDGLVNTVDFQCTILDKKL